jgi:hypothetical protein
MLAVFVSSLALVGVVVFAVSAHWSAPAIAGVSMAATLGVDLAVLALAWMRARNTGHATHSAAAH